MSEKYKEKRFLDALESLFTGAEVEGDSGFINLMRMKHDYFRDIREKLMGKIDRRAERDSSFREELFDKLYSFFSQYFCESGSIYFRHLPAFARIYERVYAGGEDVALVWKTKNLYYVKSDTLVRSMPVVLDPDYPGRTRRFYFDASKVENKRGNERREFVFAFDKVEPAPDGQGPVVRLVVSYSENGNGTDADGIVKAARKSESGAYPTEEQLERAIRIFRRQTEADFFINKDARAFLREQFDLWMYQFLFQGESIFEPGRIKQLQSIQLTAHDIIDFIAQFEDELRRVWEKPKFARNVNYVVTLDKLPAELPAKIAAHKGASAQIREWAELGLVDGNFSAAELGKVAGRGRFLPLDTKHFKDLELEILDALGNLDEALDGELVHSENWQALNSLQAKYRGRVKCIYIDPPFNLGGSDQFDYRTNYKDSCWATMLENRIAVARNFLADNGSIFVRCDYNGNFIVRMLMDGIFGAGNFLNQIALGKSAKIAEKITRYHSAHDALYFYARSNSHDFDAARIKREERNWRPMHLPGIRWSPITEELTQLFSPENIVKKNGNHTTRARIILGEERLPPPDRHWALSQEAIFEAEKNGEIKLNGNNEPVALEGEWQLLTDNWTDHVGYAPDWGFSTENHEVVLDRAIKTVTHKNEICLDFFLGIGTTAAVAQKLGRKWLGVEMGGHITEFYKDKEGKDKIGILGRMKKVLGGHQSGISKDVAYKGGGAFKYYSLEQYEETLKNSRYKGGRQIELDSNKSPFEQYVFFDDDKLAYVGEADQDNGGKIEINLKNLYPDVDIAESLANILGKPIRRRTADGVTFADGTAEMTEPLKMSEKEKLHFISLIKPYLWWGK